MTWCKSMSIDDLIRPDLIRIKAAGKRIPHPYRTKSGGKGVKYVIETNKECYFCGEKAEELILGENDKELPLCKDHFKELAKTIKNFNQ